MKKTILDLDKTRLITCAMNGGYGEGLSNVVDLQGFNYHVGDYEPFHKAHPDQPVFGSETASTVCTRGIYEIDKTKGYVTAYDTFAPDWAQTTAIAWKALADKPYMAGGFVWTGFDYRGEPTPYVWPCVNSHFGILDMCGFPKDNYWYYKSWWGSEPVLHLLPHWNWQGREGKTINVWAHTNCDSVELFLNGKSQGRQDVPALGHAEWKVAYHPGTLLAKGYRDGKQILEEKVETTGKPAALRLAPYVTAFKADGEDQVPVAVSVVDAKGRVVPTANNMVTFRVSGPAIVAGVGNGDPSCHEPDKGSKRSAFNGYCMAVLQAGEKTGTVTLTASAPGLQSDTVTLKTAE
jgi:beta-galactosidase